MRIGESTIRLAMSNGLVDEAWYCEYYQIPRSITALGHFFSEGWHSKCAPNAFFDPDWYLSHNADIANLGLDPLAHYIESGEAEGRWPCRILDPAWYGASHGIKPGGGVVLAHFMRRGMAEGQQPNPFFDPYFYMAQNPDLPRDFRTAIMHYLGQGYTEARPVSAEFDGPWYRAYYKIGNCVDPIYHYASVGRASGHTPSLCHLNSAAAEVRRFSAPGPFFEDLNRDLVKSGTVRAKAIAFYLPQFHAVPENDQWWGTGFTEWRNVCRGQPRFVGHHQPRVPRDLGFYDLTTPGVMRRQIELAKAAGIHGFCFYYYQFGKRQLLEGPLKQLLADPSLDMPICLMWANENWTRRWDGQEAEVLLRQSYEQEDDEELIANVAAAMSDPRYIRAGGRPLFLVYRPGVIPDMRERVGRWRQLFRERYGLEPWLLMAQAFQEHDPRDYDLDGAVEFPPHKLTTHTTAITGDVKILDPQFNGVIYEYDDIVTSSINEPEPDYLLLKTAVPSWDNDARRQGSGTSIAHSTPAAYQRWLESLVDRAREKPLGGEPIVFINAWNEWAEGAYLEPDVHFGSAYLNATARAVIGSVAAKSSEKAHILLVGHDAHEHGAQITLLHLGRIFTQRFGVKVTFLLLGQGSLVPSYQQVGNVVVLESGGANLERTLQDLTNRGISLAITNTVVTGSVVPHLKRLGCRVVSLVHELPRLIREMHLERSARHIANQSDVVVFAAEFVREGFEQAVAPVAGQVMIRPQGRYAEFTPFPTARADVRKELGLPATARIVVGAGYADLRKGVDFFFETARQSAISDPGLIFLWLGRLEVAVSAWIVPYDDSGALPPNVRHVGFMPDISEYGRYLQAADAFYLTSREDPFPSAVIDALNCGLPVVGFKGRTGTGDLIAQFGQLVPAYDTAAALLALRQEIAAQSDEKSAARTGYIAREFGWSDYAFGLLEQLNPAWKRISAVVPNYNYEHYLEGRLDSIFRQTVPVYEVIVLDDASTDGSLKMVERVARDRNRLVRVIANERNSGAIMKQWAKAATEASGELLWIAEADDGADPAFLSHLADSFTDNTLMACADSRQIDAEGHELAASYNYYFQTFHGDAFRHSFEVGSREFAERFLSTNNIVLNVSSVLFRRSALVEVFRSQLSELETYRFAGDWLVYLALCKMQGDIVYRAEALNVHRRHGGSATHQTALEAHVAEVARAHRAFERLFGRSDTVQNAQAVYISDLQLQFGLADNEAEPETLFSEAV